jgi:hypothetical protein
MRPKWGETGALEGPVMPDKRDMHKAKSHRNSKHAKQQAAKAAPAVTPVATVTATAEPLAEPAPPMGKKNKSRR